MDRRAEAIALLREERDGLEVTFTLPVMPSGLDEESLALLESANDHGVAWVSVWSTFRDRPCDRDTADDPLTDCSGVEQEAGAFGDTLAG